MGSLDHVGCLLLKRIGKTLKRLFLKGFLPGNNLDRTSEGVYCFYKFIFNLALRS